MRPYNDKYYTELLERLPRNLATGYEAAAAITELQQTCARLNEYRENANEACGKWEVRAKMLEAQKRWIPCSSGVMPNAEQEVRVICKTSTGYKYQCQAFYVPAGVYREDSGYSWDWECCEEYDEERGDYMVNPGWYESIHNWDDYGAVGISDTVTHWMPLPQPPKEEQDNG